MHCAACALSVERALGRAPGVTRASVSYASRLAVIDYDAEATCPETLAATVRRSGYRLLTGGEAERRDAETAAYRALRRQTAVAMLCFVLILSLHLAGLRHVGVVEAAAALVALVYGGRSILRTALSELRRLSFGMDSLVALSTLSAFLYSLLRLVATGHPDVHGSSVHLYFDSTAAILCFVLSGRLVQERQLRRADSRVSGLERRQPGVATLLDGETAASVPVGEVKPGETVLIRAGEFIPLDGVIVSGSGYVDESLLTGEPLPSAKRPGDGVLAGTLNHGSALRVRVTKSADACYLRRLGRLALDAAASRPDKRGWADRAVAVFVPCVFALALLSFTVWLLRGEPALALHCFLSVLVVACPCALGLAVPIATAVAIGRAARMGIAVRSAAAFSPRVRLTDAVFDKTGTLTLAAPRLDCWTDLSSPAAPVSHRDVESLLRKYPVVGAIEARSGHPLARAFPAPAALGGVELVSLNTIAGLGIEARTLGERYTLGNLELTRRAVGSVGPALGRLVGEASARGSTLSVLTRDGRPLALLEFHDTPRPTAREALRLLRERHHLRLHLLSGDNRSAALSVARRVGIATVEAPLPPEGKASYIRGLTDGGRGVLAVGDGLNDTVALAASTLSVAMGSGAAEARQGSDLILPSSDLRLLSSFLSLASLTRRVVRENLVWAFLYNGLALPLAAGVLYPSWGILVSPSVCALLMSLSSLTVVFNSLRLRHMRLFRRGSARAQESVSYQVSGMMCGNCKRRVRRALLRLPGVSGVRVSLDPPRADITFDGAPLSLERLQAALTPLGGYRITPLGEGDRRAGGSPAAG